MRRYSLVIGILCLPWILGGCRSEEQQETLEISAIPAIAATPVVKDITVYLESIGTLYPSVSMEIKPQTSGTISAVMIKEGQDVQQGTPLFQIDPTSYAIKVKEAEAQLAIDQAGFKAVQKKMARFKSLAERDLMAQTEWDELKAQQQKSQAAVELDSARLAFAQLELDRCTLASPISGRVGKLDAHPGLLVSSGQTLVTISTMDPLIVEFYVTEKEFRLVPKKGLTVQLHTLCAYDICSSGTVTFLDNHFDAKTGLLLIRGRVDNPSYALRPGQTIRVQIPIETTPQALLIPQKTIRYNQQGPYVYTINEDNTVSVRQLVLGKEYGADQIVLEGLEPHERLILDGHLRLSPGSKVEIKS